MQENIGLHEVPDQTRLVILIANVTLACRRIKVGDENWTAVCKEVAAMTDGMSGREIAHLALDWQMKTIVTAKGLLTPELMVNRARVAMARKASTVSRSMKRGFICLLSSCPFVKKDDK